MKQPKKPPSMKKLVQYEIYVYEWDGFGQGRRSWHYYDGPFTKAKAQRERNEVASFKGEENIIVVKTVITPVKARKTAKRKTAKRKTAKRKTAKRKKKKARLR